MYNIIQLNDKNLSELQTIAQELGIKKTDSLKKEELVYKILDEQAIAGATKKVAADKLKEERKGEKQKRSRVTVKTVKKEGADKVFSANKNGDLTKAKTEEIIIVKNNCITDTSYTNLLFLKDEKWYTPSTYLLNGVMRQHLLATKKIKETEITLQNIKEFTHFQLINSMNDFDDMFIYPIERIVNLPESREYLGI